MKPSTIGLFVAMALGQSAFAASTIVAHYRMGELENSGGTANGGTAATLLATTGSNMVVRPTTTPALNVSTGASNSFGSTQNSTAYMSFDGVSEGYDVGSNVLAAANTAGKWMMEAWVRPTLDASDNTLNIIMSNGHGGTGVCLNYIASTNLYGIYFGGLGGVAGTIGASANVWNHVALVYDSSLASGQQMKLYVDGVSAWSGDKLGTGGYANGSAIGNQLTGGANAFKGDIDDVYFSSISNFTTSDFHVVPEPTAALLGSLGLLGLLRRRRA